VSGIASAAFDVRSNQWVRSPVLLPKSTPPLVTGSVAFSTTSSTFVFGGENDKGTVSDVLYELQHRDGRILSREVPRDAETPWPSPRKFHAACVVPKHVLGDSDGKDTEDAERSVCLVVFGGCSDAGAPLNDLWMFDPSDKSWKQLKVGLCSRHRPCCVCACHFSCREE
jgi:N-acetylneuraminic acid mutarotase